MRYEAERINRWSDFLERIEELNYEREQQIKKASPIFLPSEILYRGQACAEWALTTTLERKLDGNFKDSSMSVLEYYNIVLKYAVEIKDELRITFKDLPSFKKAVRQHNIEYKSYRIYLPDSLLAYLVFLRHHSFPSPLLDWTGSPHIAAYFAYQESLNCEVAIYAYIDMPNNIKQYQGGGFIQTIGPHIVTDIRHKVQKARYTVCASPHEQTRMMYFHHHDSVLDQDKYEQDVLYKFILPCHIRDEVLSYLNEKNINKDNLFNYTDVFIQSIASKVFG